MGTRLGRLTADRPKALVEVAGRTMLEHQLRHLSVQGFDRFAINVHHFAGLVKEFLKSNDNFGLDITISDESDLLLDTGGGIRQAYHALNTDKPVLVHNVDIFSSTDLAGLYRQHCESQAGETADHACLKADATLLCAHRDTSRQLHFDPSDRLVGWSNSQNGQVKSPLPDFCASACRGAAFQGIHVVGSKVIEALDRVPEQAFSITDFYVMNSDYLCLKARFSDADAWVDAGKPDTLPRTEEIIKAYYK